MPRKKKTADDKPTYHKAKNGRFYKRIQVDGKTRVRFVSNAEATGALSKSKSKPPKKSKKAEPAPSADDAKES